MQAVLLAAGESSRFRPLSDGRHKSLAKVCGKTIIEWTLLAIKKAGIKDVIIVEGPDRAIESGLSLPEKNGMRLQYIVQEKPLGMGNALMGAEKLLNEESFFVLNPNHHDADFYITPMIEKQRATKAGLVLVGKKTDTPEKYGILTLKGDKASGLVEKPKKGEAPSDLRVVGIYLLPKEFFKYYLRVKEHMYAYEDALRLYMKDNDVRVVQTDKETASLKYPWDLFTFGKEIMEKNVRVKIIADSAKVAKSATIEGPVKIGENAVVLENAVIKGPCFIGDSALIGNNAIVREYSSIGERCVIGANAEVARSIIGDGTHMHSGFVGDSIIGDNCRIGAGIITANVRLDKENVTSIVKGEKVDTGIKSFGAVIGHSTKLGIGVRTMPGVLIGSDCLVGPASVVFGNIETKTSYHTEFKAAVKKR